MEEQEKTGVTEETRLPEKKYYLDVNLEQAEISIRACLKDAVRNVIAVGFYLKRIRDKDLFRGAGYASIWEYAAATFGFSKSTASRYMARNDKFSVGGNSPVLAEEYREYSKAQLQEMLNLDAEQLENVTPAMTVREIREMKKPRELPYYEIPGQLDISDFPEMEADDEPDMPELAPAVTEAAPVTAAYTVSAEDLIGEPEEELSANVATSQQGFDSDTLLSGSKNDENAAEKQRSGKCLHNPEHNCTLADTDKAIPGTGKDCTHSCCWECPKHGECNIECYASSRREYQPEDEAQDEPAPGPIEYDHDTLEKMLQDARELLNQMTDYWLKNQPYTYAKYSMMIQAYELLMKNHEAAEPDPEEEKAEQPELPRLKNNEQRAAFVDNYESWPLWIDNQETGERYYRYDLPDGTSFVVKVYRAMVFRGWDVESGSRYKEGYGLDEQYILKPGKFFRDCRTNRSAMIEKLKELQKSEQGGELV